MELALIKLLVGLAGGWPVNLDERGWQSERCQLLSNGIVENEINFCNYNHFKMAWASKDICALNNVMKYISFIS